MVGTLQPGDHLIVKAVAFGDLRPGDVVAFLSAGEIPGPGTVAHRAVRRTAQGWVTQGDNNPCPDDRLLTGDRFLGRITHAERHGQVRTIHGGRWGLLRARILRLRCGICRRFARLGRSSYRWLRDRGFLQQLWQPNLVQLQVTSDDGPLVKYLHDGQTVARWWPATDKFECQKPYDLIIRPPDDRVGG